MNVQRFVREWTQEVILAFNPTLDHLRKAGYSMRAVDLPNRHNFPRWNVGIARGRRFYLNPNNVYLSLVFERTSEPDEVEVFYAPGLDVGTLGGKSIAGKSLADDVFMLGNDRATKQALVKLSEQGPWVAKVLENYQFPTLGVMEWRPESEGSGPSMGAEEQREKKCPEDDPEFEEAFRLKWRWRFTKVFRDIATHLHDFFGYSVSEPFWIPYKLPHIGFYTYGREGNELAIFVAPYPAPGIRKWCARQWIVSIVDGNGEQIASKELSYSLKDLSRDDGIEARIRNVSNLGTWIAGKLQDIQWPRHSGHLEWRPDRE